MPNAACLQAHLTNTSSRQGLNLLGLFDPPILIIQQPSLSMDSACLHIICHLLRFFLA